MLKMFVEEMRKFLDGEEKFNEIDFNMLVEDIARLILRDRRELEELESFDEQEIALNCLSEYQSWVSVKSAA